VRGCAGRSGCYQSAVVSHTAFDGTKVRHEKRAERREHRPDIWDSRLPLDCLKSNIAYWVTPAVPWGIHLIGYALPPEGQDTRNGCSDEDG
jgi:hypothetical protein